MKEKNKIEIARSFSFKLNLGNYQTADFFCSEKTEAFEDEAEEKSEALHEFCKREVIKSVNAYKDALAKLKEPAEPKKINIGLGKRPIRYDGRVKAEEAKERHFEARDIVIDGEKGEMVNDDNGLPMPLN